MTHSLDRSSCRECQQWKSNAEEAAHDSLAGWEFMQKRQQWKASRGAAHDSLAGWEFMQEMSAMEIMQRSCT
jgi:hypothetical protein